MPRAMCMLISCYHGKTLSLYIAKRSIIFTIHNIDYNFFEQKHITYASRHYMLNIFKSIPLEQIIHLKSTTSPKYMIEDCAL